MNHAELTRLYADSNANQVEGYLSDFLGSAESPIEESMLSALLRYSADTCPVHFRPKKTRDGVIVSLSVASRDLADWRGFLFESQAQIGKYRVDILVRYRTYFEVDGPKEASIVIECDGHDFHEKTKEQAKRDKKRDRVIQQAGHLVFRYTGSEIYRDAEGCVKEAMLALLGKVYGA